MTTLTYRFAIVDGLLDVRLLADGREVGSTVVTPREVALLTSTREDPEASIEAAYSIRSQLLPRGWPETWLSLATMTGEIRKAWDQLRVRTPGDAG